SSRYAKRQLTWFRNRLDALSFDLISEPNQKSQFEQTIKKWLEAE
ncbi:tRNA (adenosine(37)-N6)-dimethylallyltransferase MiaA, partial [Enterococcus faecium]